MSESTNIRFRDLPERHERAVNQLKREKARLELRSSPTAEEQAELTRINTLLDGLNEAKEDGRYLVADPLFVAVRDAFNDCNNQGLLGRQLLDFDADGRLHIKTSDGAKRPGIPKKKVPTRASGPSSEEASEDPPPQCPNGGDDFADVVRVSLILGLLAADGVQPPRLRWSEAMNPADFEVRVDTGDPAGSAFTTAFFAAYGQAQGAKGLARRVLSILDDEGDPHGDDEHQGEVDTSEFAHVIRCLQKKGFGVGEGQLSRRVNECLDRIQSVGVDRPMAEMSIALPDLNEISDYQIQTDNVRLMGAVICAAMFEELKVFQVVDKLVELAQNGMLPVGRSSAGETLYHYWRETPNRMSEAERRGFYAMAIGIPGGGQVMNANRDFNDLWLRFVSSVSSLVRQKSADALLRATIPAAVSQQQVRKSARDLALNLSSHGYGMSVFYALELQGLINTIIELLSNEEVRSAYGARDMWQVIDQVATLELGGARNSARYRTLATCGAIITAWLAENVERYNQATSRRIIAVEEVLSTDPPTAGAKATTKPTDYDLVNACELWLADTATSDDRVEEMAQPREAPMMTSRPVQIPGIAREMLEQAGVPGLGMGLGTGRR